MPWDVWRKRAGFSAAWLLTALSGSALAASDTLNSKLWTDWPAATPDSAQCKFKPNSFGLPTQLDCSPLKPPGPAPSPPPVVQMNDPARPPLWPKVGDCGLFQPYDFNVGKGLLNSWKNQGPVGGYDAMQFEKFASSIPQQFAYSQFDTVPLPHIPSKGGQLAGDFIVADATVAGERMPAEVRQYRRFFSEKVGRDFLCKAFAAARNFKDHVKGENCRKGEVAEAGVLRITVQSGSGRDST